MSTQCVCAPAHTSESVWGRRHFRRRKWRCASSPWSERSPGIKLSTVFRHVTLVSHLVKVPVCLWVCLWVWTETLQRHCCGGEWRLFSLCLSDRGRERGITLWWFWWRILPLVAKTEFYLMAAWLELDLIQFDRSCWHWLVFFVVCAAFPPPPSFFLYSLSPYFSHLILYFALSRPLYPLLSYFVSLSLFLSFIWSLWFSSSAIPSLSLSLSLFLSLSISLGLPFSLLSLHMPFLFLFLSLSSVCTLTSR